MAGESQGRDIDGDAALFVLFDFLGHAGGDVAVDGNIDDFTAIELVWENDGAGLAWQTLDYPLALKCPQVAHRGGLAGESEEVLDFPRGRHDPRLALGLPHILEDFLLALGEVGLHRFMNSVPKNKGDLVARIK